ncbi:PAS domain-containing protein [Marinobacterium litorale]|uniref:PAS domain-containing protein n=1 Tax=Marinobacterium litorale TaxID=404770 RepID=UPI00040E91D9|nr:PAS domain-containing protein [Marinobacterium litorale]
MSILGFKRRRSRSAQTDPVDVLDSLDEAVVVIDEQERILYRNRRWESLEQATGQPDHALPLHRFMHPLDQAPWREFLGQLNQGQRPDPLWVRLPVGEALYWCELRAQPLYKDADWPISLSFCDITPQVRRDQQRDASHRSLNQLVSNLPVMLYRARNNRNWSMEYVSEGCLSLTGYSADALVNQPRLSYGALIHPEDAGPVWEEVQQALHDNRPFELYYRIHHANGAIVQVREKGQGLYAESGAVLGVEGVIFTLESI